MAKTHRRSLPKALTNADNSQGSPSSTSSNMTRTSETSKRASLNGDDDENTVTMDVFKINMPAKQVNEAGYVLSSPKLYNMMKKAINAGKNNTQKLIKSTKDLDIVKQANLDWQKLLEDSKKENRVKDGKIQAMGTTIAQYEDQLKKKGVVLDKDINDELQDHIIKFVKDKGFRLKKFFVDENDAKKFMIRRVKKGITINIDDMGISDDEFFRVYLKTVCSALAGARQSTQSQCKNRAYGTWQFSSLERFFCVNLPKFFVFFPEYMDANGGTLPTSDEILQLLLLDPAQIEEGSAEEKKLIWYFDRYLPAVAGNEYWGNEIRFFHLFGAPGTYMGKELKSNVTITSEGFGLLLLENCHDKWIEMRKFKKEFPSSELPKKGDEAKKFEGKYTEAKQGQKKFGGWSKAGYDFFNETGKQLMAIRENDAKHDHVFAKYIYNLLRKTNDVTAETYASYKPPKNNKKRDTPDEPEESPTSVKLMCFDEDEDEDEE